MDWLFLLFLPLALLIIFFRFTRPCEQKLHRAIELTKLQHFQKAHNILSSLSKDKYASLVGYSDRAKFMSCQALCLLNLSRSSEAVEIYDRLTEKIPNTKANLSWLHQSYFLKGAALVKLEQYEQAIISLDTAIKYKSDNGNVWYLKACALEGLEQFLEAIDYCDRALQYEPQNFDIWLLKAKILYELENYHDATIVCDYVLQNRSGNHLDWELQAKILYAQENYQEAVIRCDRALQYKPDYVDVIYSKACCYIQLGNTELALATLKQVMDLAPQTYEAVFNRNENFYHIRHDEYFRELLTKFC